MITAAPAKPGAAIIGAFAAPRRLSLGHLRHLSVPLRIEADVIVIDRSPQGHPLKNPVRVPTELVLRAGQRGVVEYVIRSLSPNRPSLIPFAFENRSCLEMARYLLRYRTGSSMTLYLYIDCVARYARWLETRPDELVADIIGPDNGPKSDRFPVHVRGLEDFVGELQDEGLSPLRICNYVKAVRALYRANGIDLKLPQPLSRRVVHKDRAPRPEELTLLLEIDDLREKVVILLLALGGFREGTLVKLRYHHVRNDLERGIVPVHVHIESEITKGKYHDYDTFLGGEVVECLNPYLEARRRGSLEQYTRGKDGEVVTKGLPPEEITDESPLIRDSRSRTPKPIGEKQIYQLIHGLYFKAGLLKRNLGRTYDLKVHSIRKYFKTQLVSLGIQSDYVDYMMGHTIDTYNDVQSKGVEFLRNVYASSGLSIRPKTKVSEIDALKRIIRAWGMNPEKILTREALSGSACVSHEEMEDRNIQVLRQALRELVRQDYSKGE